MKKILSFAIVLLIILSLVGCQLGETNTNIDDIISEFESNTNSADNNTSKYEIDYLDAKSFESALNDGEKVKGKIVQFDVVEYKPDSAMGVNCWSGEHLNFISANELDVKKGDIIVGRVSKEPTETFGSWKIQYEVLEINSKAVNTDNTSSPNQENDKPSKITMTMSEEELKGLTTTDAEKKLKEMGFTKFKQKTVDTDDKSANGTICYIEITELFIGNSDFKKGDKFDLDSTATLYSYKYEESQKPSPVFYSSNDYETAKKGNTGVFSYKKSGSYDTYWIIDFDEGYVYFFTDGNGETTCDKLKIVSGHLNDKITITWYDGGSKASWYLHFKYVNSPVTLIVNDHLGLTTEFTTTDLDDALALRNTKKIVNN